MATKMDYFLAGKDSSCLDKFHAESLLRRVKHQKRIGLQALEGTSRISPCPNKVGLQQLTTVRGLRLVFRIGKTHFKSS